MTIPYISSVSEALQRALKRHGVVTSMKPHKILKQLIVHPKDKRSPCTGCVSWLLWALVWVLTLNIERHISKRL